VSRFTQYENSNYERPLANSGVSTLVSASGVMHSQVFRRSTNVRNV